MSELKLKQNKLENNHNSTKKITFKEKVSNFFKDPKKRLYFIGGIGLLIIIIFGIGLYLMTNETSTPKMAETKKSEEPQKTLYPAILTGELIEDKDAAGRHPIAVIVENDTAARPQSGLDRADIVYETVYDPAATTRFMAVYSSEEAEKVGPVRSVRTFFVDLAHGLDAYLGHWGGNMDALDQIRAEKAPDLDEFAYPGLYWRDRRAGVSSDHTGYTSTIKLREQADKNGYERANNFNVYKFKDLKEEEKAALPESQKVTINHSNQSYLAEFTYNKNENNYKRSMAGSSHNDSISKTQLTSSNLIVMEVKRERTTTRINEAGYRMDLTGTGKASIYLDGKEIKGTWKKESADDREMFYDDTGKEIEFNRGSFWICLVPALAQVKTI